MGGGERSAGSGTGTERREGTGGGWGWGVVTCVTRPAPRRRQASSQPYPHRCMRHRCSVHEHGAAQRTQRTHRVQVVVKRGLIRRLRPPQAKHRAVQQREGRRRRRGEGGGRGQAWRQEGHRGVGGRQHRGGLPAYRHCGGGRGEAPAGQGQGGAAAVGHTHAAGRQPDHGRHLQAAGQAQAVQHVRQPETGNSYEHELDACTHTPTHTSAEGPQTQRNAPPPPYTPTV